MAQNFAIKAPELAGFSVLGATAGASLSSWLMPGSQSHVAVCCATGAIILPLICAMPQSIAGAGRWMARAQLSGLPFGGVRLAKGDTPA